MSIKLVAKIMAVALLLGLTSSPSVGQTSPGNSDSSAQPAGNISTEPASSSQSFSDQSSGQAPSSQPPSNQSQSDKNTGQTPAQGPAEGQAAANPQPAPSTQQSNDKEDPSASGQGKVAGTSNDRLFYALPNFLTLQNGGRLPPLSTGQKFKVVALGTFDPVNYPWWGIIAAISQADDGEPGFGQGWLSYAKRYGSTAGDSITENFMVGAVYPSILRQDPRFYYSENGGYFRRTMYAVTRVVLTRGDNGHTQFNFSEILGAATAAAATTNTFHPKATYISTPSNPHEYVPSERTLGNTATTWGTQVGLDTITFVIKEFWPDIHHRMAKRREAEAAKSAGSIP